MDGEREFDFSVLPDGCVTHILSFTSPRDACRSSAVSTMFKFAADSDIVWGKFIPEDYKEILLRSINGKEIVKEIEKFESKKEVFFYLCQQHIIVDGGKMSFILDKSSGMKSCMLGARKLTIIWGDSPQYWVWQCSPGSRFEEEAILKMVCWLDISGKIDTQKLSPRTTYVAYFVMKLAENASGLNHPPVEVSITLPGSFSSDVRAVSLDPEINLRRPVQMQHHRHIGILRRRFGHALGPDPSVSKWEGQFPKERGDGWLEIEMGEFFTSSCNNGVVEMKLTEIKNGHWKYGLIVQGIELRPKGTTSAAAVTTPAVAATTDSTITSKTTATVAPVF